MQDYSIDGIFAILQQTVFSLRGVWSIVFASFIRAQYHIHSQSVYAAIGWAVIVTAGIFLVKLNRKLISHGPTVLENDDVVVITGAASGLGLYLAALIAQTNKVVAVDIKAPPLSLQNTEFILLDCKDEQAVSQKLGSIKANCLINCAGIARGGDTTELNTEDINHVLETNFLGPIWCTRALLPYMKSTHGYIVNVSSSTCHVGPRKAGVYAASKAALRTWHLSLTQELSSSDVKTILVTPGQLDTKMFQTVKTPDRFLAPIVSVTDLGDEICRWLRAGYAGEIVTPLYVKLLPIVMSTMPQTVINALRVWNGLDKAMNQFQSADTESERS